MPMKMKMMMMRKMMTKRKTKMMMRKMTRKTKMMRKVMRKRKKNKKATLHHLQFRVVNASKNASDQIQKYAREIAHVEIPHQSRFASETGSCRPTRPE